MRFSLRTLLAPALLAAGLFSAPALAQTPEPGLPMWVIKDKDSTIYVTGTIHMLPPDVKFDSDKLKKAIHDAGDLTLEIPMGSDINKFAAASMPVIMKYAMAPAPLSSLLTAEEVATLKARLIEAKQPPEAFAVYNMMKPWFATTVLGVSPLVSGGYDPSQGIDLRLAKLAEEDGDPIKGFETIEEQTKILSSGSDADQLAALRKLLAAPPADIAKMKAQMDEMATKWAHGDVSGAKALFEAASLATDTASMGGASLDALLKNRNINWANQIETMLKGAGVHFIAVGAGHLVGPDNLFDQLKVRGIEAQRY